MAFPFECPVCGHKNNIPQTNEQKIRAMSDDELAAWIAGMSTICECCAELNECASPRGFNRCSHGVKDWLQQPEEGE